MTDIFSWEFDAPSGTYKNHALSRRLYEQAVAETKFMDFTNPVENFGRGMGESVTLTRIKAMSEPDDATLTEGIRIPEDEFALTTKSITVTEIGRAVPYTSLSMDLSAFDLMNPIQRKLMEQLRLVLDTNAATAFKKTPIKFSPTSTTAGSFNTSSDPSATDAAFQVYHVGVVRDYLFDTLFAPGWGGGDYVTLMRTKGIRSIKADDDWEKWHMYTDPAAKYNGEVGRLDTTRFVEINHSNALGQATNLGEGVTFGMDAVVLAEVITPELRVAQPDDFGRSKAVAWYGVLKFDIVWETANAGECKIVHITNDSVA